SRTAYKKLVGGGPWENQLQVLNDSDVRSLRDPALVHVGPGRRGTNEEEELVSKPREPAHEDGINLTQPDRTEWEHRTKYGTGESRRLVSWIWTGGGKLDLDDGADENGNEILRAEWCKSRARLERAEEEVKLVKEEMRRTLEYLDWSATEWEKPTSDEGAADSTLREGMEAYRKCQARTQRELRSAFRDSWKQPLSEMDLLEVVEETEEHGGESERVLYGVVPEDDDEEEEDGGGELEGTEEEDELGIDYDISATVDSDDDA
ncbi:hypothetical protein V5O48_019353, partial [Marasmius crinis-equi]